MSLARHEKPNKGATDTWLTPPEMIEALGPFDTDPCVPEGMPWKTATRMITEKECDPAGSLVALNQRVLIRRCRRKLTKPGLEAVHQPLRGSPPGQSGALDTSTANH